MKFSCRTLSLVAALSVATLCSSSLGIAAQLTAPTLVASSLKRFVHDDADMVRRVQQDAYELLAKEEKDFAKDADLLLDAIREEPTSFQRRIEASIQQVLSAAHRVTVAGQTHQEADIRQALETLAEAVRKLNAEFPADLRSAI